MNSRDISRIKIAARIASSLIEDVLLFIRPGQRECDISSFIRRRMKAHGASGESFKTIVAAGKRTAMPHGYATKNRVRKNDFVMVDCGVRYKGVCSDITRMLFLADGKADCKPNSTRITRIYRIVKAAQAKAIRLVRSGAAVKKIDLAVRKEFRRYGLEKYFPHSTGHGICRFVHEDPRISHKKSDILEAGTVITIEPGLYFPREKKPFGVRIEDMVLVKKNSCEVLTKVKK